MGVQIEELRETALTMLRLILSISSKEKWGEFGKNLYESHKPLKKQVWEKFKELRLFILENLENLRVFRYIKSYNPLKSV